MLRTQAHGLYSQPSCLVVGNSKWSVEEVAKIVSVLYKSI